ncbi:hypothetical protein GW17_00028404 [Ensete ventricosum]|nr:hypothetical protein GW17_00028404 [Ensete ventricosum]
MGLARAYPLVLVYHAHKVDTSKRYHHLYPFPLSTRARPHTHIPLLTMEASFSFTMFLVLSVLLHLLFSAKKKNNKKNLPPSPPSLPFIGHLHLCTKPLHRCLARLTALHGPVLLLRFGARPVLVVASPAAADECFTTQDITFANRPSLPSRKYLLYKNNTTLGSASYGPYWRNLRRIATVEVLSSHRLRSSSDARAHEVRAMARELLRACDATADGFAKVELKSRLFQLAMNVLMRMIAGKRYSWEEEGVVSEELKRFMVTVQEIFALSGASNVGDFIPLLRWVDYGGVRRKLMRLHRVRDEFLQQLIDELRTKGGEESQTTEAKEEKTTISDLLSLQKTDPENCSDQIIKSVISVSSSKSELLLCLFDDGVTLILPVPMFSEELISSWNGYDGQYNRMGDVASAQPSKCDGQNASRD